MKKLSIARVSGHTFISSRLSECSVIIDLGANRGAFSREIRDRWGCSEILAVEPAPALSNELSRLDGVGIERCVVSGSGEPALFRINEENSESSSIVGGPGDGDVIVVRGTTLRDLMARYDAVDLVKIDVEGAEIGIFRSTPGEVLLRAKQFTVEFHDFKRGSGVTRGHVMEVMERMRELGFKAFVNSFWTYGDVLFVNQNYFSIRPVEAALLSLRGRWWPGATRVAHKLVRVIR